MARQGGKGKKSDEASATTENMQQNSVFGRYSEAEMLSQLKELALDPRRQQFAQDNIRPLFDQILRVRKVMVLQDSEIPWRKRKLEQFVKDKLRAPCGFGLPDQQNVTKMSRKQFTHASSVSCSPNSVDCTRCRDEKILVDSRSSNSFVTFDYTLAEKSASTECSIKSNSNCPSKDASRTVDTGESVNKLNSLNPENPTHNEAPSLDYLNSPTLDGPKKRQLPPPRRSIKLPSFVGNHPRRHVIPVGPRFQAEVPEWHGSVNRRLLIDEYIKSSDNSKWLGTRIWPIEIGNMKSTGRIVGKGRSNSCSCVSPGSVNCVRRHILEKRQLLQCDLGPAFFSWKFDEMGDQVLKFWTSKEQQTFESLMKVRPSSNGKNFLKHILKCFRSKCGKDIVGYYFNVYIPQRLSLQTRSSSNILIDTDDEDESDNFNYLGVRKSSEKKTRILSNSKEVKARFSHRAS